MKKVVLLLEKAGLTLQTFKTALAAALAWIAATQLFAFEHPYFAPLSAILTVQVTVVDSWEKAAQRIIALIGGIIVSMLIGQWFSIGVLSIFLAILLGMALAKIFRLKDQIVSQVAVSSFLLLAFGDTQGYLLDRAVETVLGSAIAIAVNASIVPQKIIPAIHTHILALSNASSRALTNLVLLLESEDNQASVREDIQVLKDQTEKTIQALRTAEKALVYTPFLAGVKTRLAQLAGPIARLEHITVQIRGIRRGLLDLHNEMQWRPEPAATESLKAAMRATATCISRFGEAIVTQSDEAREQLVNSVDDASLIQLQCLAETQQITSLAVLRDIGSILTDLKRILKEVELP